MTGMILDGVLMLLLVAALGYGVRLERKLTALREGQQLFASAVTELNDAAGRAEAALATLRSSGHETDLLHDRIVQARRLKLELEGIVDKRGGLPPLHGEWRNGGRRRSDDGTMRSIVPGGVRRGERFFDFMARNRLFDRWLTRPTRFAARTTLPMKGRETAALVHDPLQLQLQPPGLHDAVVKQVGFLAGG